MPVTITPTNPDTSPTGAPTTVKPVTERALIRRINRILAHEGKVLRVSRYPSQGYHNLGRYYQQDIYTSMAGSWFTTLGELITYAKDSAILAEDEYLTD
ncbi:MAG: hypothetical protein WAS25_06420 [Geothrix sp.]|uniref:hypothetical protein n=1 Tax=Geothrix sp. TaxID=1962974 RepID=UPI003BAF4EBA